MIARRLAEGGVFALIGLVLFWHLYWLPTKQVPAWFAISLHALPVLPAIVLVLRRRRSAAFWGAMGALLMFSHGVMEAWASPVARLPALIEIALALLVIIAASWNGMRARFGRQHKV